MSPQKNRFVLSTSPFVRSPVDTPSIMRHVIYSLIPAFLAGVYYFRLSAVLVVVTSIAGCAAAEWILNGRGSLKRSSLGDGSAVVTGMLLGMTLPPGLPLWMAFLGGAMAIILGKAIFGGLGQNIFNPSLVGRVFLQSCFPVALTTWSPHGAAGGFFNLHGDNFALPFLKPSFDAVSAATPLAQMKFESTSTNLMDLVLGTTAGSIGETSALLLLLGGAYLAYRGFLNWRIPLGIFASVFVLATAMHLMNPAAHPDGAFHIFSGGLMLGAVFMATDPVSSPVTPRGCWVFATGVGVLIVVIRQFSGLPEGVMYSILLMNGATPLIDRWTQPRIYGARKAQKT